MRPLVVALAFTATIAACTSTPTGPDNGAAALVIYGAGAAAATGVAPQTGGSPDDAIFGGASSLTIRLYALYISPNADCSAPVLVQQLPAAGTDKDFMLHPVLFQGTPANGSYQCVMFKMSDVLKMKPSTSFGACVAGVEYSGDIYRDGESDWKDVDMNTVVGTGTDELPVDDHVTIFMSTNPDAALARGISEHQLVPLLSPMIVPGQNTFVMDASHAVMSSGGSCGLEKIEPSFQ